MGILAAALVSATILWVWRAWSLQHAAAQADAVRDRALQIATLFAPGLAACASDPRAFIVWQRLAVTTRKTWPEACALLDAGAGGRFPFTDDQLQAAHSRWTADWLAWERTHDGEFKLRVAAAEHDLAAAAGSALSTLARARLDAVEREKLDLYQRRYEEYVRTAKALQSLLPS